MIKTNLNNFLFQLVHPTRDYITYEKAFYFLSFKKKDPWSWIQIGRRHCSNGMNYKKIKIQNSSTPSREEGKKGFCLGDMCVAADGSVRE